MDLNPTQYHIIFVGGGISSAHSLLSIFHKIKDNPPIHKLNILMIEKSPNFYTGIAYGPRSSQKALLITNLGEFLHPEEKESFKKWFYSKIELFKKTQKIINYDWLQRNLSLIESGELENVFLPRSIYGEYLTFQIEKDLKDPIIKKNIRFSKIQTKVIDIDKKGKNYILKTINADGNLEKFKGEKLILAMGHFPKNTFSLEKNPIPISYFNDPYFPGMDQNLLLLKNILENISNKPSQILIIGTNASALELLYLISNEEEIINKIQKIHLISPSGDLPSHTYNSPLSERRFEALERLTSIKNIRAEGLMEAIQEDLQEAKNQNLILNEFFNSLNEKVILILNKLSILEKKKFHEVYGMEFTKLIRRSGIEYGNAVDFLNKINKIEIKKGKFNKIRELTKSQVEGFPWIEISYSDSTNKTFSLHNLAAIFDCSGYPDFSESNDPFVKNLMLKQICTINPSKRGIKVNHRLEGSKNVFIIGPPLGGLFTPQHQFWHVENSKRIYGLSKFLADQVMVDLVLEPEMKA